MMMEFLLKSSAIIGIFYFCYILFLQRETFFESNRWFLLSGLVIASCIGFIIIPNYIEITPTPLSYTTIGYELPTSTTTQEAAPTFDYTQLLVWTYFLGATFFMGRLIIQFFSLQRVLRKGKLTSTDEIKLISTESNVPPFSFFNYIVYNPSHFGEAELEHVINHEKAHSKEFHSVDTIIAQIACILLWFNPLVWLYKKALQQNLEFIADRKAQYISTCKKSYQTVLLKASVPNYELGFTNNFYTSLIKKRIVMLHKSKSRKRNQLKLILVLPILALFIMSFNTKTIYITKPLETAETINSNIPDEEILEIIITKNSSDEDLLEIQKELKAQGITFTYSKLKRNKDGEITGISTTFLNEKSSTEYSVKGTDPIKSFKFQKSNDQFGVSAIDNNSQTVTIRTTAGDKTTKTVTSSVIVRDEIASDEPIFIINGKRVEKSEFEDIDSEKIKTVNIIKGDKAIKTYGASGKNGVVVMTTKDGNKFVIDTDVEEDVIVETKQNFFIESDGEDAPLLIMDGEIIEETTVDILNTDDIKELEILKDDAAIKIYGQKGKNGVIKVTTFKSKGKSNTEDEIIIIEETKDPKKVVSGYQNKNSGTIVVEGKKLMYGKPGVYITKSTSDAELKRIKSDFESQGLKAKFSKVRRNDSGQLTGIKISLTDSQGNSSTSVYKGKTNGIPKILMGKIGDDIFIKSE